MIFISVTILVMMRILYILNLQICDSSGIYAMGCNFCPIMRNRTIHCILSEALFIVIMMCGWYLLHITRLSQVLKIPTSIHWERHQGKSSHLQQCTSVMKPMCINIPHSETYVYETSSALTSGRSTSNELTSTLSPPPPIRPHPWPLPPSPNKWKRWNTFQYTLFSTVP